MSVVHSMVRRSEITRKRNISAGRQMGWGVTEAKRTAACDFCREPIRPGHLIAKADGEPWRHYVCTSDVHMGYEPEFVRRAERSIENYQHLLDTFGSEMSAERRAVVVARVEHEQAIVDAYRAESAEVPS